MSKAATVFLAGLTLLVGALVVAGTAAGDRGRTHFCTLGAASFRRAGVEVWLQDGGEPGPDGCDGSTTKWGVLVLGMDCKLRDRGGDVFDELQPNSPDGRCVMAAEYPRSWIDPHAG